MPDAPGAPDPADPSAPPSPARPVVRLAELRSGALSVEEVLAATEDGSSGGVALFVGRVRDHDHGRDGVRGLEYQAHPSAAEQLHAVCAAVAAEHDLHAVAAVHRTGWLDVGDTAVVVATASAHRGVAFEATRVLIDRLKAEVPIWKHQRFADGDEEWVGVP